MVVHPGVLLGAAAAIALLSFGLSSWLHATNVEIKHIHKRIDRLVRSKLGGAKRDGRSSPLLTSPQLPSAQHTPSHFPIWASALRGDVELLMEKNRFLEEEMQILRVRLERQGILPTYSLLFFFVCKHKKNFNLVVKLLNLNL